MVRSLLCSATPTLARCQAMGTEYLFDFQEMSPVLSARRTSTRYPWPRSEEHTSELQSLMRISYAVFCLKKKKQNNINHKCSHIIQPYTQHHTQNTSTIQ